RRDDLGPHREPPGRGAGLRCHFVATSVFGSASADHVPGARARADLRARPGPEVEGRAGAPPAFAGGGMNPGIARLLVLGLLRRGVRVGQLTVIEGGRRYVFGSGSPRASV